MLEITWIYDKIKKGQYLFSKHADLERQSDYLKISEIEQAILSGRILENYPDSGRGESCLIAGFTDDGKPVHVVCGERNEKLVMITVYIPSPPKFKNTFEKGES